ncbi:MAG: hypothetical protein ABL971_16805 [Vicinamibacterales bacterium]
MRATDVMPLAHGLGGRSDLPVPLWIAVTGAVLALLFSFAALVFFWKKPKFSADPGGRAVSAGLERILNSTGAEVFLKLVGLVAFVLVLSAAWIGTNDPKSNPAPAWVYVWFWVGLLPLSLIFGPVVKAISPLRTIAGLLSMVLRGAEKPIPASWGMWPAAISLYTFVWLELVDPNASLPRTVAVYLTVYALIHIIAGVVYGQDWFERGEGFEVYSTLVGRLSPFARTNYGHWVLRNPLHGLALTPPTTGLTAVITVLLGSTAFDGLTRTPIWRDLAASQRDNTASYLLAGTLGLTGAILVVAGIYWVAMRITRAWLPDRSTLLADFAPSLVPIAIGYTIAHYFSFAVFDGQLGWILASDPFGRGWDLFGTAGGTIDYSLISTQWIALVQVAAIAIGHIAGVVIAHERAISLFPKRYHLLAQYPMLCAMVAFTMSGIALVVGSEKSFWMMVTVGIFMPMAALFVWITAPVENPEAGALS